MPHQRYILDGQVPVPCDEVLEWRRWFRGDAGKWRVAQSFVESFYVSTIFLGIDYGELGLFETRALSLRDGQEFCQRSATWDEALETHKNSVAYATRLIKQRAYLAEVLAGRVRLA